MHVKKYFISSIGSLRNLSLKTYLELNEAINNHFNQNINIQIIPQNKDLSKTPEYFKNYETDHELKVLFKKDDQFNKYYIAVTTDEQKQQCTKKVDRINKILKLVGLDELEIYTDLSIRTNIQEQIKNDKIQNLQKILEKLNLYHYDCNESNYKIYYSNNKYKMVLFDYGGIRKLKQ